MATPEGKIKTWLDTMLKREKIWFYSPQSGPYGTSGIPDRVAIVCGLFIGIEVKADSKRKMTALQELCFEKITKAGGVCFLVYDKETIELVRRFVTNVRTYRTRQEGSSGGVAGSRCTTRRHTNSAASEGQPCACAAQTGGGSGTP